MADTMIDLWYEYEKGETQAARLVKQVDKLECIHQAVVYETQNDVALDEFMTLKDKVTLPELKPLLETCLDRRGEIVMRKKSDIVVIFVIGKICQSH
jgi:UMP-CMP kinase